MKTAADLSRAITAALASQGAGVDPQHADELARMMTDDKPPFADAPDLTADDKGAIAWIEWWMSHHERDGKLGGTLAAALAQLRDLMERFDIPGIPID